MLFPDFVEQSEWGLLALRIVVGSSSSSMDGRRSSALEAWSRRSGREYSRPFANRAMCPSPSMRSEDESRGAREGTRWCAPRRPRRPPGGSSTVGHS